MLRAIVFFGLTTSAFASATLADYWAFGIRVQGCVRNQTLLLRIIVSFLRFLALVLSSLFTDGERIRSFGHQAFESELSRYFKKLLSIATQVLGKPDIVGNAPQELCK